MTKQSIEQEIQAKGLNAPRITPTDIEAKHRDWREGCHHEFTGRVVAADGV